MKVKAVLAVDTSGSMSGKKLSDSKDALLNFTEKLPPEAEVGIVSFGGGGAKIVRGPTSKTSRVESALKKLTAGGSTPLHAGLKRSFHQINDKGLKTKFAKALTVKNHNIDKNASKKTIVLSTDGKANVGPGNKGILRLGRKIERSGIRIVTVAIGNSADTNLLRKLASGEQNFHEAEFSGELPGLYEDIAKAITPKR